MAALVEQALQKLLGLEGLPLADEDIYGVAEPVPPKNGPKNGPKNSQKIIENNC